MLPKRKKIVPIDAGNYREAARDAIGAYLDRGNIIDALFWREVIACYERKLKELRVEASTTRAKGQRR